MRQAPFIVSPRPRSRLVSEGPPVWVRSVLLYWAQGGQKQENCPRPGTERAALGMWRGRYKVVGTWLCRGGASCSCFVLKRGAGPQGHRLTGFLKQCLALGQEVADQDPPEEKGVCFPPLLMVSFLEAQGGDSSWGARVCQAAWASPRRPLCQEEGPPEELSIGPPLGANLVGHDQHMPSSLPPPHTQRAPSQGQEGTGAVQGGRGQAGKPGGPGPRAPGHPLGLLVRLLLHGPWEQVLCIR